MHNLININIALNAILNHVNISLVNSFVYAAYFYAQQLIMLALQLISTVAYFRCVIAMLTGDTSVLLTKVIISDFVAYFSEQIHVR